MTHEAFKYNWLIGDGYPAMGIPNHQSKVFGTFICGGGSSMGYKLAGYDHLGGVEIDPAIADVYQANHHPKYLFREDIRSVIRRQDLPAELFNLDLLDGSPPCSSFSLAGNREDDWGKEKVFREGQALQRLDDLFFDYISLAGLLQPKVVIAENVAGLILGNARAYVHDICQEFKRIGYVVQLFHLNGASMGVPQKRERVFFICRKESLDLPKLLLEFRHRPITFAEVEQQIPTALGEPLTEAFARWWRLCKPGASLSTAHPKGSFFNSTKLWKTKVPPTITATVAGKLCHYEHPYEIHPDAISMIGSFPRDYQFNGMDVKYLIGMSVPPVMMANIAYQVYDQWLRLLK